MCSYVLTCGMAIRFIIEHEARVTRPTWDGWTLCLQWGALTDEDGKVTERGYRNIWRDKEKRLFTGRAQTRLPSKAISDELWSIAESEGWANLQGDGADLWQRVIIRNGVQADQSANGLMNAFSKALHAAGCLSKDADVFCGQNSAKDHIFFFSPKAADIASVILEEFSAMPCHQPDFGSLQKARL